jgi:rhodanese-related sulfurtransferase
MQHHPGFLNLVDSVLPRIQEVSVEAVQGWQRAGETFSLIDVREDHEWLVDRAKGAIHVGRGILERDIESLVPDLDTLIVLYCGGGFRSALAADNLQQMGYTRVRSLAGGIKAWRAAQAPLEH